MRLNGLQLPDFLIVGSMKAGTTTLFEDLRSNPAIFMPALKELPRLGRPDEYFESNNGAGLAEYAEFYAPAKPGQIIGDASTQYTKHPDVTGAARRARKYLGPDLRLIYLVRNPVERIISHHYHDVCSPRFHPSTDIDFEVREHPHYLNWTRYAMQIEQWLEFYDASQVMIVRFEDFVSDRRTWVGRISEFLGVVPRPDLVVEDAVYNKGDGRVIVNSTFWHAVRTSRLYRSVVHPFVSVRVRERLRALVLSPAPPRPAPPKPETVTYILDELADDMERLRRIMGRQTPVWDLDKTKEKYGCSESEESDVGGQSSAYSRPVLSDS